ncbi:conjugal transfer protein TraE [Ruminococcaceae bacterium OttesenSCG-928-L11]|nr:conjugal transfer protein TraE [Ruminococcaceae bacterium OttesenSCG-928-L11]
MYRDGICRVSERLYSKTIAFGDINYHLAQPEDQTHIFEGYSDFLNYFDSTLGGQLSCINLPANAEELRRMIKLPQYDDDLAPLRNEFGSFLEAQQAKGNNGMTKRKFATFTVEADNLRAAKLRAERVETDILNNYKVLGAPAAPLDGKERLKILFDMLHPSGNEKFRFDWKDRVKTGLSTKDFIAPSGFDFREGRTFRMGEHYGAVSHLQILASELGDRLLADFLDLESPTAVTIHFRSLDQTQAIKNVKRKLSDLDAMKINEQKKAVRSGYDLDIISADLATYGGEAKMLLEDLQSRNERMFVVTILVLNIAKTRRQLENDILAANAVAQKYNCALNRLDYQQEQGLMSSLPLGLNQVGIKRGLTTSSTAIFVPFTTCELFQTGEAMYYGLNALSNNLIMANRKNLKNPNGLYLGTPGSGKSFAAKREILSVYLTTQDDIIISDPESEYFPLVNRLGGQVVKLSPVSKAHINPMDINVDYSDEDDPLTLKSDFVLSLCELIIGGKDGLQPVEKTIIDRCVRLVYRDYLADPKPENMPILEDLYNLLRTQSEAEAQRIATALEIYVTGSLNIFNNRSNVDITNRLVCYDIKELGKQLKKLGMLILQDQVWGRVTANRALKKTTWFYSDEFHLLLKDEQTAAYSVEIWKRFRKWGGIPTALTQNVKDMLASPEVQNIMENSDFIYMLNQAQGDRQILAKQLGISPHQLSYVTQSGAGEGLLFYGNVIIPFVDRFDKSTEIYSLLTTKFTEAVS